MNEQKRAKLLSVCSLICGIMAPIMICYWYIGMIFAVAAIGLGTYVRRRYGGNRMITAAYICAGVYVAFFVLLAVVMGLYYNMIHIYR